MKLTAVLVLINGAALAQAPDLKSVSGYPKMVQKQVTAWIERAAEKMPEEEYAFKPDPASRSFGQILGHIADAGYLFCSTVLGESSPSPEIEKTKTTKAELPIAIEPMTLLPMPARTRRSKPLDRSETSSAPSGSTLRTTWSTTAISWSTCG
jgi:hypothetical protein